MQYTLKSGLYCLPSKTRRTATKIESTTDLVQLIKSKPQISDLSSDSVGHTAPPKMITEIHLAMSALSKLAGKRLYNLIKLK